ncbi:hypothetical protein N825_04980 [Skermanella stibiiresistens SB22]|uniref:DUF429 domain-containing protein n=1 Tax=Skermanella stibiiresistens SB22 TaxID=1385369 RepID=W9H572_9PROT|nr:hypothetical protein [Skermanella stibiiresistens]EWY39852.1 hypothetical protein N825_04980 [Skermanella stibiiresistens SB22]
MTGSFDSFIGIDWSGATGKRYQGIAVAECGRGRAAPHLIRPPTAGRVWTRTQVLDWLDQRVDQGGRLLIGIDCAFSLPFDTAAAWLPRGAGDVFALWDLVERACQADADLFGGAFPRDPAYAAGYWTAGPRVESFHLGRRATEDACRAGGYGSPESPFKLIGAKQVGKGALAGMRLLRALRARRNDVKVWPFEPPSSGATIVEIYPRLFLMRVGWGTRKVRSWADLNACLDRLDTDPIEDNQSQPTDHETDALVSAAGLRALSHDPRVWAPPGLNDRARRQEGWIFGVGQSKR